MAIYKTPGVYVEEISTLPPSVAPVATAIPAFIGYTEKAIKNDQVIPANTPTRIQSLLEFIEFFGGPFHEFLDVEINDPAAGESDPQLVITFRETNENPSPYVLYHHVNMHFANGGGPCWIVSVGEFLDIDLDDDPDTLPAANELPNNANINAGELQAGVAACEEVDEITLLVVPEAVALNSAGRSNVYNDMLTQCEKLQDRFAIMDVISDPSQSVFEDGNNFRSTDVGSDNLKYGAAYYPQLRTLLSYPYRENDIELSDQRSDALYDGERLSSIASGTEFVSGNQINSAATLAIRVADNGAIGGDMITIDGETLTEGAEFNAAGSASDTATDIMQAINTHPNLPATFSASIIAPNTTTVIVSVDTAGAAGNNFLASYTDSGSGAALTLQGESLAPGATVLSAQFTGGHDGIDMGLYNFIKEALDTFKIPLYPSGTMAGVYARIDGARGVWKAPANTSVRMVKCPAKLVTDAEQDNMNVDTVAGKSINVIRNFAGKGNLVWGARTLAGNDNEWRYVPVRRLFIFMEESIKKATEPFVFEPNDANTWKRVKGMIENFLVQLWRDGALAGATPEEAFFVKVGLGETMTPLDILEGRMNVEIGVAAVRPAEFIILKFSHKMQES